MNSNQNRSSSMNDIKEKERNLSNGSNNIAFSADTELNESTKLTKGAEEEQQVVYSDLITRCLKEEEKYDKINLQDQENTDLSKTDSVCIKISDTSDSEGKSSSLETLEWVEKLHTKLTKLQSKYTEFIEKNKSNIKIAIIIILVLLYAVYFISAMLYSFGDEGSIRLLWMTIAVVLGLSYRAANVQVRKTEKYKKLQQYLQKIYPHKLWINRIILIIISSIIAVFVIVDVLIISRNLYNLVSLTGIIFYIILLLIFSKHLTKVNLRVVFWGLCLQFIFALLIMRTHFGLSVFEWLGDRVSGFFSYANYGCRFVFGEKYTDHYFAFKVLPVVIFFSSTVSVLYHWGVMQLVASWIAWIMQISMGTSPAESLTAAANIFLSQTESLLLVKPFLEDLTIAELHSIMTSGLSTVSGGILVAYVYFGVSARHLLSASVMSAPAALAMSKLIYPETEPIKCSSESIANCKLEKQGNVIEALSSGAASVVKVIAVVAANLIAFISTLHFINGVLTWFGNRIGIELLTFQMICSYVLWPLALVMGVRVEDCGRVAQLIGIKTFLNEFIAYESLGVLINNKVLYDEHVTNNGTWYSRGDDVILVNLMSQSGFNETVLEGGFMSDRSETIATYALCGFSNIGSMGIMVGVMSSFIPHRRSVLANIIVRALVAGTVACFITACIAGLFYEEK